MINPGPLYFGRGGRKTFELLKKYYSCGFRYITCPSSHELNCTCKKHNTFHHRRLRDVGGYYNTASRVCKPYRPFQSLQSSRPCLLGGMLCGIKYGFVRPEIRVIEDTWQAVCFCSLTPSNLLTKHDAYCKIRRK